MSLTPLTSSTSAATFEAAREECRAEIRQGSAGRAALERYASRVDDLLRQLHAEAQPDAEAVAVLALGGYGRRHLCLYSDIDLLVLFRGPIGPDDEQFLRGFLHPLWDLNIAVGHHVREVSEFERLETDNPEFLLALLDARLIAGSRNLFDEMMAHFHQVSTHGCVLASLLELIDARHARFNGTLYQLEPDIKDAPGALRDLTATRTIAMLADPVLLRNSPSGAMAFDAAEDFLLRIRSVLHLECGRNENELSHELQERVADTLGYTGPEPRQRVERMMSEYFRHARIVSRSLDWARQTAPMPVGPNLGITRDGVAFMDAHQAARSPASWLLAFLIAVERGVAVSDEALLCIRQHVDRYRADDFFIGAEYRKAAVGLLRPRIGLYDRLSEMHDCGLLGRVFPEFQAISWRVIRDFYHKYTVDEHTLLTIRNLERLATTELAERRGFRAILEELTNPELLVLALLYHDVGKWRDEDHATESVRMAEAMLERLELAPQSRDVVLFLIKHHLQMSTVAFRRDTEDPEIVREFASLVGTEERLRMLTLMTLVDVEAVSPDTLTAWKAELLWRLYMDAYNHLTKRYGDEIIERNHVGFTRLLEVRPEHITVQELETFVSGLPQRYLHMFTPASVYQHVEMARGMAPEGVHVSWESTDGIWTLAVIALDKPMLFSNTCGVLASFGMNILRGHAFTNPSGLVLDVFQFTDDERFLELNADGQDRVTELLEDAVSGRTDVSQRLRSREHSIYRGVSRFEPVIRIDNGASSRYTIVDIVTSNAVGLLHRISRAISIRQCEVELVLITTEGERAIDVFHITKDGAKLTSDEQDGLAADLHRTLEGAL